MSESVIRGFYEAFARLDGAAMAASYHPQVSFSDPVFPDLRGAQVGSMWRMLSAAAAASNQFKLDYRILMCDERKAMVRWQADYRYAGNRKVRNSVLSTLTIWDDAIVRHVDEFPFWRWSRQALGTTGWLCGWAPPYQRAVQRAAQRRLELFMAREAPP
ncbi:MAG: nuclear transport factor 2 family protein [Burkholderiales bacterium]|nr:nuclear transport factor 2 family protein [Burkholderiales bacterium]ODU62906.1 MAG: hypothetical protein ABT05_06790 [Lautropia sp. SCN 66-9]